MKYNSQFQSIFSSKIPYAKTSKLYFLMNSWNGTTELFSSALLCSEAHAKYPTRTSTLTEEDSPSLGACQEGTKGKTKVLPN